MTTVAYESSQRFRCVLVGALAVLAASCGGETAAGDESLDAGASDAGELGADSVGGAGGEPPTSVRDLLGVFRATLYPADPRSGTGAYSHLWGQVYGVPTAPRFGISEGLERGCRIRSLGEATCVTACASDQSCWDDGHGGRCFAQHPPEVSVGTVTVQGMRSSEGDTQFTIEPDASPPISYGRSLAYPPFADGDGIHLAAAGGYYEAFSIDGRGIDPVASDLSGIDVRRGQPLDLTWNPPPEAGHSRIAVSMHVDDSAGVELSCDVEDTGFFEIPADLVTALIDRGVGGDPGLDIIRHATSSVNVGAGRVELSLSSWAGSLIAAEGYRFCRDDADCRTGQTCALNTCGGSS